MLDFVVRSDSDETNSEEALIAKLHEGTLNNTINLEKFADNAYMRKDLETLKVTEYFVFKYMEHPIKDCPLYSHLMEKIAFEIDDLEREQAAKPNPILKIMTVKQLNAQNGLMKIYE